MRPHIFSPLLVLALSCLTFPALAESANALLRDVGFTGAWSRNCSLPPDQGPWTLIYAPSFGQATLISYTPLNEETWRIDSAERVSETKFRLIETVVAIKFTNSDGRTTLKVGDRVEVVWEKLGDKFKLEKSGLVGSDDLVVRDGVYLKGPTAKAPTQPMERCLDR